MAYENPENKVFNLKCEIDIMKTTKDNQTIKYAFKASLPVCAGYIVLGIGFGILMQAKGYSFLWSVVMALTIYAGSMQYVAVDLLSSGATLLAAAMMTLMVNIRHIFYGIAMLKKYQDTGKKKLYLIFALTDETFSLVCDAKLPENVEEKEYYFWVSLFDQCYWVMGCLIGSLIGGAFAFNSAGVEFSMTALFVVIFVSQWENTKNHTPAITGVIISLICLIVFGAGDFLIPTMAIMTVVLLLESKWLQKLEIPEQQKEITGEQEKEEDHG